MRLISWTILIAGLAGCGDETQVTQPLEAHAQSTPNAQYAITKFAASLGGVTSRGTAINNRGWVAGFSNLPGDNTRHAALWRDGSIRDLGTLGGPNCPACNSSVVWPGLNDQGTVVGIAETADLDPLGEEWSCTAFFPSVTGHICRGFVWENGVMQALPTLGGNQGFATGVNSRDQVVGWAETTVHDPTCNSPQVLQFRAVLWQPQHGAMQQLPPLPGDSTSAATAINDKGQAVGISGDCDIAVGRFSARHSVRWENGTVTAIPNLGGATWNMRPVTSSGFPTRSARATRRATSYRTPSSGPEAPTRLRISARSAETSSAKPSPSTGGGRWWAFPSAVRTVPMPLSGKTGL